MLKRPYKKTYIYLFVFFVVALVFAHQKFVPYLIAKKLPQALKDRYGVDVVIGSAKINGFSEIVLQDIVIKKLEKFQVPGIEKLILNELIFDLCMPSQKMHELILLEGVKGKNLEIFLKTGIANRYRLDFHFKKKGLLSYHIKFNGDWEGAIDINDKPNLSWQVDVSKVNSSNSVINVKADLKSKVGEVLNFKAEWLEPFVHIDIEDLQFHLGKFGIKSMPKDLKLKMKLKSRCDISAFDFNQRLWFLNFPQESMLETEVQLIGDQEVLHAHWSVADTQWRMMGKFQPDAGNNIEFQVNANEKVLNGLLTADLEKLSRLLPFFGMEEWKGLAGGIHGVAEIGGTTLEPEIEFQMEDKNLFYGKTKIQLRSESFLKKGVFYIPVFQVLSPNKELTSQFQVGLLPNEGVYLDLKKFSFGNKNSLYSMKRPVRMTLNETGLNLHRIQLASKNSQLDFFVQLLKSGEGLSRLAVKDLLIKEFLQFWNIDLSYEVGGKVTAELKVQGDVDGLKVQAIGKVKDIKLNGEPEGEGVFDVVLTKSDLDLNLLEIKSDHKKSFLSVKGSIPIVLDVERFSFKEDFRRDRNLILICKNTSTTPIRGLMPKVEKLDARVTGELSSYKLEDKKYFLGELKIENGTFATASNLAPLTNINGSVVFTREAILIPSCQAKMGDGRIELKGKLSLLDLKVHEVNFLLKGSNLKVVNDEDLSFVISPDISYTGPIENPALKGLILVDRARYDDSLLNIMDKIESFKNPSRDNLWSKTALDVEFRCDHNVVNTIKQTSFFLEGSGKVRVTGYVTSPELNGSLRIEKGRIPIYSKEFIVEGGTVNLEANRAPYANLVCNYRGNNIDVKMQINQSLDEALEPVYTSLPSYTEEEIWRYLVYNLLPGQEGEGIDFISFLKTSIEYSDVLSIEGLQWLKRFSFETRTRNREGREDVGISIEYTFDEPEWFSVKSIQDDAGVFNFFLVANLNFMGYYIDASIFQPEDFRQFEPKELGELAEKIKKMGFKFIPKRLSNEFDVQYIIRVFNFLLNIKNLEVEISDATWASFSDTQKEYIKNKDLVIKQDSEKNYLKTLRVFNRNILEFLIPEAFKHEKQKKAKKKDQFLKKGIKSKELSRSQRRVVRQLVRDEMKSYVNTNDTLFLDHASKKIMRLCMSWGYKDASVTWQKQSEEYLDKLEKVAAVVFFIEHGEKYRFKGMEIKGVSLEQAVYLKNLTKFVGYKSTAPIYFSENYTEFLMKRIKEYYLINGYLDVSCRYLIDEKLSFEDDVYVNIHVDPGDQYFIGNITIEGNRSKASGVLLKYIEDDLLKQGVIKESGKFLGQPFHMNFVQNFRKSILEYYRSAGYMKTSVKGRVKSVYEFASVDYFYQNITFDNLVKRFERRLGKKSLLQLFPELEKKLKPIELFNYINQVIYSDSYRWKLIQNFSGFEDWPDPSFAQLYEKVLSLGLQKDEMLFCRKIFSHYYSLPSLENFISEQEKQYDLVFQIEEEGYYRFGDITYRSRYAEGFKTKENLIKKQIRIQKGDEYDIRKIRETVRTFSMLGVFQEIDYQERIEGNEIHVDFILRESKTVSLELELGYGEFEKVQGGVRIFDHNIFGTARSLGLKFNLSARTLLIEPIFDTPFWGGFRNQWVGFYERVKEDEFTGVSYGFETNITRSFGAINFSTGYKFENTSAKDVVEELQNVESGFVVFSGAQGSVSINKIDNLLLPHKGSFLKFRAETNLKAFGSTFDFFKTELQATQHLPVTDRITFSVGTRLGFMKSFSGGVEIPIQVRFFNGGGNTIRGYEHNGIGPVVDGRFVGGELRGIFNSEIRFPLTLQTKLQFGVVFFDAGFLEESIKDLDKPDWFTSVGVGYRYLSPIGPIRLDLGFDLHDREKGLGFLELDHDGFELKNFYVNGYKARLHLSFGYAF